MNRSVSITWLGHACFKLVCDGYAVVIDPYSADSVPGLGPLEIAANTVLISHLHRDHNAIDTVWLEKPPCDNPFEITSIPTYHDNVQGAARGDNTIHLLRSEGLSIVHLGDLGCLLNEKQYLQLMAPDVLMIPIGGHYTIDAAAAFQIIDRLQPRVVLPMHFRNGPIDYPIIATADEFISGCTNAVWYESNSVTVDQATLPQTAFLKL